MTTCVALVVLWGIVDIPRTYAGETLKTLEREIQALIDSTTHSVVTVSAHFSSEAQSQKESGLFSFFKSEKSQPPITYVNIGSGIVYERDGYILTRSSIVLGADRIRVTLFNGKEIPAEFVGYEPESGFAVIKIEYQPLQAAHLGNSDDIVPGSWNIMIGNSYGVYPSVTFGTVNGLRNDGMLQISADLYPGNNGNPVLNVDGEIIALIAGRLNTFDEMTVPAVGQQTNFATLAYPINWVKRIADDIINYGYVRKGWLGVVGYHDSWQPTIRKIKDNSPAKKAGLSEGDVIVKFSYKNVKSISELARLVEYTTPGETVNLEFLRDGKLHQANIRIGERKPVTDLAPRSSSGVVGKPAALSVQERTLFIEHRIEQLEKELAHLKKMVQGK